jgi:hypothetical protein
MPAAANIVTSSERLLAVTGSNIHDNLITYSATASSHNGFIRADSAAITTCAAISSAKNHVPARLGPLMRL